MNNLKCPQCGRPHSPADLCPLGLHAVIDADTIERVERTGHPRLLRLVLNGEARDVLNGVNIDRLTVHPGGSISVPGHCPGCGEPFMGSYEDFAPTHECPNCPTRGYGLHEEDGETGEDCREPDPQGWS